MEAQCEDYPTAAYPCDRDPSSSIMKNEHDDFMNVGVGEECKAVFYVQF